MEQTSHPVVQEDEITLRDLILQFHEWTRYLLQRWKIILIFGLVGAGIGFAYSYNKKYQYTADLSFVMEEGKSNALGAYSGLASQFGIDLGGSSGGGVFAGENILEFLKSRLLVEKTLLSPIKTNGTTISLADFYIQIYDKKEAWGKKPDLKNISFPPTQDRSAYSLKQDSILNTIYEEIKKTNLNVLKPDKKLSFILVSCKTENQHFSKVFVERLVKEAIDFYIQTKTMRSKANVDKLQAKADSIEGLLNRKTYSVAASRDLNLNPARSVARVGTELATRDQMVLQTMYAEIVKNLELSRMSMSQETPIIQIVDRPILPLKKERFGKLKGLVIGGFVGGILILAWLIVRRIYKRLMV